MFLQIIIEGVINGSIIALVAIGISLIWGVMNILNFAQGEFLMLGMYVGFYMNKYFGWDPIFSLPVAAVVLFCLGFLIYKTMISRVLKGPILSQRLLTFALSMVLMNLALKFFSGEFKTVNKLMITGYTNILGVRVNVAKLVPFVTCIILAIGLYLFINKTRIGKAIQATSMDRKAASLMGIDSENSFALAFSLSAAVTGMAGCILTYYYYVFPGVGATFQLFGFIAVAMGGFGSIIGALFGGILMGVIDTTTGVLTSPAFKYLAVCIAYVVIVSVRPKGLFGR